MCYEMVVPVCRDPQDVMPGMVGIPNAKKIIHGTR